MRLSVQRGVVLPADVPLDALDQRLFAYVASLQAPFAQRVLDRRLNVPDEATQMVTSLVDIYDLAYCLPWLFNETFPNVTDADLIDIAEAGLVLFLALLLRDHLLDEQLPADAVNLLLQQRLFADGLRRFQCIFDATSPFWRYFDSYMRACDAALLSEITEHRGHVHNYPLERVWELGSGKMAPLKIIPMALALKSGRDHPLPQLAAALDAFAAAMQLGDDLSDWEEDYRKRRYTLPLTWLIPADQWAAPTLSTQELRQYLDDSLIAETLLDQTLRWLHQAIAAVADLDCPDWVALVEYRILPLQNYYRQAVARRLLRVLEEAL